MRLYGTVKVNRSALRAAAHVHARLCLVYSTGASDFL